MTPAPQKQQVLKKVNADGRSRHRPGKRKVKKLSDEAFRIVDERAVDIIQSLLASTLMGHVLSAKLLVDLAEGSVDIEDALSKNPLRTLAMDLAAEPEWQGDSLETQAEQRHRSQQPEAA